MSIKVKKLTAIVLTLMMVLPLISVTSFAAVSESEGMNAIRGQWSRGEGPVAGGYDIDYSYFSPIANGSSANKEYPLVVILPGFGESTYEGEELIANDFPLWSAKEYQQKFYNGGAYLLIARSPEESGLFWNNSQPIPALKAAIDDFCVKNPNVDTNRIYALGWSYGAAGAIRLTANYNNFIAASLIFSPGYSFSDSMALSCRNKAIWIFGCKNDGIFPYGMYVSPSWDALKNHTVDASKLRLTTTDTAPTTITFTNHNTWKMTIRDMADNGGCTGIKTVDGNGNIISNPSVIAWLSEQSLIEDAVDVCTHICHQSGFMGFIYQILRFFWQLFGIEKVCSCGVSHY